MAVDFANLEPVLDLIPGTLTVNGTDADNAIDYRQGTVAANGLVSVDAYEAIEFSNKTTLVIDGRGGSDVINLNNAAVPTGLTGDWDAGNAGVQSIGVIGGSATAGDRLIVNGTGGLNNIGFTPTAADAGVVMGAVANATGVSFNTIEALVINGLGGLDVLTLNTPAGRRTRRR